MSYFLPQYTLLPHNFFTRLLEKQNKNLYSDLFSRRKTAKLKWNALKAARLSNFTEGNTTHKEINDVNFIVQNILSGMLYLSCSWGKIDIVYFEVPRW